MTNKQLLSKVFGAYDIRGLYGQDIDEKFALNLGWAYGDFICRRPGANVLVGHDARPWSPGLAASFGQGISRAGHNAICIGLASTPLSEWYGAEQAADGIAVITASHLGHEYTGFKLSRKDAVPISSEDGLCEIASKLEGKLSFPAIVPGALIYEQALVTYIQHLRTYLKPERRLRIALDAGNGAVGPEISELFKSNNDVEIVALSLNTGVLSPERSSNPLQKGALDRLCQTVIAKGCAFGAAFDGDGDRIIVVDETGRMMPPDVVLGILANHILRLKPGATVLFDLRSTRAVKDAIEAAGGKALRTRVGHSYIRAAMRESKAVFAGELSGHYYYDDFHYTDNSMRSLIELINIVSAQDKPVSQLAEPYMGYSLSGEMNFKVSNIPQILKTLKESFADGDVDLLDGVSVNFPDWWFNARPSNTEPLLRVTVGAVKSEIMDKSMQRLLSLIESNNAS